MSEPKIESMDTPIVLRQSDFDAELPERDVLDALRSAFATLAAGTTVQPPQVGGVIANEVDVLWYAGILGGEKIFGSKLSPYFPERENGPKVTAWTIVFSSVTGNPLLLCDSLALTTERTAATTALAVQLLLPVSAKRLAVIGIGRVGRAHLRYAFAIHEWNQVSLYSRSLRHEHSSVEQFPWHLRDKIKIAASAEAAVLHSDVILLCTSSATPVIDYRWLRPGQLVTSITTNAPNAHEVAPEALAELDVYCDYHVTTPAVAGEMKLAVRNHGWSPESIRGDLPELVSGQGRLPTGRAPVFFRSVGLGIEDLAIATVLLRKRQEHQQSESSKGSSL
jgi:L-arginine dehydrogenase